MHSFSIPWFKVTPISNVSTNLKYILKINVFYLKQFDFEVLMVPTVGG